MRVTGDISYDTNALEEWKEARSKINDIDKNLHELRKYGLAFIAALLAVNSILDYSKLSNLTKFCVSVITISFITILNLVDHYYQYIIEAVSNRARVLETVTLNIELDEVISYQFEESNLPTYIRWTYNGLIIMAVAIGVVVIISIPSTPSVNAGNLSYLLSTSSHLSNPSSVLVILLKMLLLLILLFFMSIFLLGPLHVIKDIGNSHEFWKCVKTCIRNDSRSEDSDSKLRDIFKNCSNSFKPMFRLIFLALYYILILVFFYFVSVHLFSSEITLSILLILIGCIGICVIDFWREIILNMKDNYVKSKKLENANAEMVCLDNDTSKEYLMDIKLDWIIDRLSCNQGERIKITVINLDKKIFTFKSGMQVCKIISEDLNFCYGIKSKNDIIVPPYENCSWFWDTGEDTENGVPQEGMYRVRPCGWEIPLRRPIFVRYHCKNEIQEKHL